MFKISISKLDEIHTTLDNFSMKYINQTFWFINDKDTIKIAVQNHRTDIYFVIIFTNAETIWLHESAIVLKNEDVRGFISCNIEYRSIKEKTDLFQLSLMGNLGELSFEDIIKIQEIYDYFSTREDFSNF